MTVSWNLVRAGVSSCHSDVNIEISVIKMSEKTAKSSKIKDRSIFRCDGLHGVLYQARADAFTLQFMSLFWFRFRIGHILFSIVPTAKRELSVEVYE